MNIPVGVTTVRSVVLAQASTRMFLRFVSHWEGNGSLDYVSVLASSLLRRSFVMAHVNALISQLTLLAICNRTC